MRLRAYIWSFATYVVGKMIADIALAAMFVGLFYLSMIPVARFGTTAIAKFADRGRDASLVLAVVYAVAVIVVGSIRAWRCVGADLMIVRAPSDVVEDGEQQNAEPTA